VKSCSGSTQIWRNRLLVVLSPVWDLLFRAKHLFVAADCYLVRDLLLVAKHLFVAARTAAWACGHPGAGRCVALRH
jgi:hypothetical protein